MKIDYREFLISLANVVAPSKEAKIEFAFSLFDVGKSLNALYEIFFETEAGQSILMN